MVRAPLLRSLFLYRARKIWYDTHMDELFRRRLLDLSGRSERSGIITHTAFLTPEEQAETEDFFRRRPETPFFFGGYEGAERRMAFFLPDGEEDTKAFIECLRITGDVGSLAHRDYLGAVLSLGLEREAVGDILPGETGYLFCEPAAAAVIERELIKIGRQNVKAAYASAEQMPVPEARVKELRFTVRSLRLDAVAAGLFSLSRSETAERIERGDCSMNHRPVLKPDAAVKEGDTIILRGEGKGTLKEIGGHTKKDRIFITCEKRI